MSKSRSHDSYAAWGEYRKQCSLLKDFTDWKQEAREDMQDMSEKPSVYIIINEWNSEDAGDATLQEIVNARYFDSEDEAWEHLAYIAESYHVELDGDDTSLELPDVHAIRNQSYYIQELTNNG